MKKTYLALTFFVLIFSACDVIEHPEVDFGSGYLAAEYGPPPSFDLATAEMKKSKVLIEDFTGHDCGNCPRAARAAEELHQQYPDRVFILAVHAGSLALPTNEFPEDFTTPEGEEYFSQLDLAFNPVGRINRSPDWHESTLDADWPNLVSQQLASPPTTVLKMELNFDPVNQRLNVHAFTEFVSDYSGGTMLSVIVSESGLIGTQLDYSIEDNENTPENEQIVTDYLFEHVMRDVVNTTFGLPIKENPSSGDTNLQSYTYDWNPDWDVSNSSVTAICYDSDTGRVLGVIQKKINA